MRLRGWASWVSDADSVVVVVAFVGVTVLGLGFWWVCTTMSEAISLVSCS